MGSKVTACATCPVDRDAHLRPPNVDHSGTPAYAAIENRRTPDPARFRSLVTAATRFYVAGLPERVIAEIMGWEGVHVGRIIRRYVDRSAATKKIIQRLNERRT